MHNSGLTITIRCKLKGKKNQKHIHIQISILINSHPISPCIQPIQIKSTNAPSAHTVSTTQASHHKSWKHPRHKQEPPSSDLLLMQWSMPIKSINSPSSIKIKARESKDEGKRLTIIPATRLKVFCNPAPVPRCCPWNVSGPIAIIAAYPIYEDY